MGDAGRGKQGIEFSPQINASLPGYGF